MAAREQQLPEAHGEVSDTGISIPAPDAPVLEAPVERQYRVEVLSDTEALMRLHREWDELLARTQTDHPFLSHAWIASWWQCFGDDKSLHILLVRDGARLVGVAPLMRCEKRMYGMRVRCLQTLYNPHTPRFDFIVAPQEAESVYRSIWRHLRETGGWDMLELCQFRADARTLGELSQLAREDGCIADVWHGEQSPYIPFNGTWDAYFAGLDRNQRNKMRRMMKHLQQRGEVHLEAITASESVEAALQDGLRIEAAAWKSQNGTAIGSAPDVELFYRIFADRAVATGMLRLLFLTVAGVRIAFAYGLFYQNKLYVLKTGYDPEYAAYSPYHVLCYLVFQDGFAQGLAEYEFLGNNESWKLTWTSLTRLHNWLYIFAPGARARLLHRIKFRWIPLLRRGGFFALHNALLGGRAPSDRN
jgi:CelD/BcsL family acetyltransferase involved in cellulose biosynthesis